jgi:Zn-dependent peptidase ImmA (M78 family)
MEISSMARLYNVRVEDLLAGETQSVEALLVSRFRAATGLEQDPAILGTLSDLVETCREVGRLEREMDQSRFFPPLPRYDVPAPRSTLEAIRQGQEMAEQERARLRLGDQPVQDVAELLSTLGLRVWSFDLPSGTSGLFFSHPDTGAVIVVNGSDSPERRVYSYAHEYCHALSDRDRGAVVSIHDDKDPIEKRADLFAINFLAPESGVRAHVAQNPMFGEGEPKAEIIATAARHFGTSYDAMAFHLANLRLISRQELEECRAESMKRDAIARVKALHGPVRRVHETPPFSQWVLRTCVLGLQRKLVSRSLVDELCERAGVSVSRVDSAIHPKATARDDGFY